ncbi:adaptorrelated protein complex 1, mu 1 subunit isoform 10, putative [Acanthamoeba castellanii str. Neff]|uniref:Adaptorrelated protein complex 1, mu 1 subunit isoform 10, putative n=1 Tax=Acanthamoeba castellanii (strain ATCC 30010 / Neff) TaxID=1257118 RepID=L8GQC3_ACACF|nr:adaptorrelated protein complex 1, mu 1 subunit isoform 10, putative [Acanthamoeba castellanii str. Neff]ELR15389.1 adaptorrelated protein complex 1, mu 1 subunit isoform 10, putative [Acanthamoeba castellanii str. Neff]
MDIFMASEDSEAKPIFVEDGITYVSVNHSNLILLAVTPKNADAAMMLLFLYKLIQVLVSYFNRLEEESIKDNFIIIYELLDEMMDFGYPQATDAKILKEFITQDSYKLQKEVRPAPSLSTAVPWRNGSAKYASNEVFLDVSANGAVLRSDLTGQIRIKPELSGMPNLSLGLNDRLQLESSLTASGGKGTVVMEDIAFNQCVSLTEFERDRIISFIPPDEEFSLMTYRLSTLHIKPLIWVEAIVNVHQHSRVEYLIKARAQFKTRSTAKNVNIFVPVPPDADSPKFRTNSSSGSVKYVPEKDAICWHIPSFQGGKEFLLRAHVALPSTGGGEEDAPRFAHPPITVHFEIPGLPVSGLQVRYLKVFERSGYQALPWVRYVTMSGDYQFRLA